MLGAAKLVPKADGWLAKLDSGLPVSASGAVQGKNRNKRNPWR